MRCTIRKIIHEDDEHICHIIKTVGAEFSAIGDGFGPSDAEVRCMSQHYNDANNAFQVRFFHYSSPSVKKTTATIFS